LMFGLRMGRGPVVGDEEREEVPGLKLSLAETDDDEEEFRLSLRRRLKASPEGATEAIGGVGFVDGNGRGGGINALVPVIALVPNDGVTPRDGRMNLSATVALSTAAPPPEAALAICLGGERASAERMPLLAGRDDPVIESLCRFLSKVGTKPSRSREINREDNNDSLSSS